MSNKLRVLDFDIENRPLTYLGSDFTTSDVTAIAWAFTDKPSKISCSLLTLENSPEDVLAQFAEAYAEADMVTGHYILGHDLPIIQGALLELNLPPLEQKSVSDTKVQLMKRKGISASQESLAELLGCDAPKIHMTPQMWRESNRLTPKGLEYTRKRVVGDVKQHMQMRARLIELNWLSPATLWTPHAKRSK